MSESTICLLKILGIALGIAGFIAGILYYDYKDIKKAEKEDLDWLEQEKKKPKFAVYLTLNNSTVKKCTLDPFNTNEGSDWNCRITSEDAAKMAMDNFYKNGFFRDDTDVTYPVCNVTEAVVRKA